VIVIRFGTAVTANLALSKRAHDLARELVGERLPPREVFQSLLFLTVLAHAVEALWAGRMARRRGLSPAGWRRQTFRLGFPSLLVLRQVRAPD
jgi:hypothetical protein